MYWAENPKKSSFRELYNSSSPSFLAVYGRRRVGKTFLIKEFFEEKGTFLQLTGIKDKNTKGKLILFFDELPWLASPRSGFLQALDYLWNRHLSSMPHVILIICGSAASWMINKVINSKGGLHNRITHEMRLLPFTLKETKDYLESRHIHFDLPQLAELYFAVGGVAKYLSYITPGHSAAQSINRLCFSKTGPLLREFQKLYHSLFSKAENHIQIVRSLAKKRSGLTYKQLAKESKLPSGGSLTQYLKNLKPRGLFLSFLPFAKGRETRNMYWPMNILIST